MAQERRLAPPCRPRSGDVDAEELQQADERRDRAPDRDHGGDELPVRSSPQQQRERRRKQCVLRELRRRHEVLDRLGAHEDPNEEQSCDAPERRDTAKRRESAAQSLPHSGDRNREDSDVGELDTDVRRAEREAHRGLVVDVEEDDRDRGGEHEDRRRDLRARDGARAKDESLAGRHPPECRSGPP